MSRPSIRTRKWRLVSVVFIFDLRTRDSGQLAGAYPRVRLGVRHNPAGPTGSREVRDVFDLLRGEETESGPVGPHYSQDRLRGFLAIGPPVFFPRLRVFLRKEREDGVMRPLGRRRELSPSLRRGSSLLRSLSDTACGDRVHACQACPFHQGALVVSVHGVDDVLGGQAERLTQAGLQDLLNRVSRATLSWHVLPRQTDAIPAEIRHVLGSPDPQRGFASLVEGYSPFVIANNGNFLALHVVLRLAPSPGASPILAGGGPWLYAMVPAGQSPGRWDQSVPVSARTSTLWGGRYPPANPRAGSP